MVWVLLGSHCPCTTKLGEAAAHSNSAAFFPHPFRGYFYRLTLFPG